MFTTAQKLGYALFALAVLLPFVRRKRSRLMQILEAVLLLTGFVSLLPVGVFQFAPFRSAVRDLIIVLIIAAVGRIVQKIAGTPPTHDSNDPRKRSEPPQNHAESFSPQTADNCIKIASDCGSSSPTVGHSKQKVIVTLLHGTFQPGASWVSKDSEFSESLRRCILSPVKVEAFRWSGKNSHEARIAAANQLREHVLQLKAQHPDASQVCIGHSHGGSVLHYALSDPEFEAALKGYAFLSTPFLHFQTRDFGHLDATEFLAAGLAVVCVSIPSYALAIRHGWSFAAPLTGPNPTLIAALLLIPFAAAVRFYRHLVHRWRHTARDFIKGIPRSLCRPEKSLFVRTPADEASNVLGLIYTVALLQVHAQFRTERYLDRLGAKRDRASPGNLRNMIDLAAVAVVFSTTALWSALCSLLCAITYRIGFGGDVAKHSFFLQVTPEVTPVGTWAVTQLSPAIGSRLSGATSRLAHSSYAHPEAGRVVAAWINELISQTSLAAEQRRAHGA